MMIRSNVRELMRMRGMTFEKLIASSGIARQTIVNARGPRILTLTMTSMTKLAAALGVKVKDLFDESDEEEGTGC